MRLLSRSKIYTVYTVLSAPVGCIAMVQTDRSGIQCRPRWDCCLRAGSTLSTLFCLHLLDALLWFKQTGLGYSVDPDKCCLGAGSTLSTLFCLHLLDAWLLWFKETGLGYSVDPDETAVLEQDLHCLHCSVCTCWMHDCYGSNRQVWDTV